MGYAAPSRTLRLPHAVALHAFLAAAPGVLFAEAPIRFDRDIRPLLAENCYACHGPGQQEAGLRLDSAEAAGRELESGSRALVPGDAAASELVARIRSADPDVVMPPPHSRKVLDESQKQLLERWIAGGAVYEAHWSFGPVVRPNVPGATDPEVTNPIDRFLESRIAAAGLPLNGAADRPTLIRRLSFAITGLPPTPAEVDAFVADASPDAYEKLVERLLASPHHGEEMARHWLDAARYADTHGLHLDNERQTWAYRDWVVKAFNANMPFDQFTIHQIAGDLLPQATRDQQTATGFCRANVTTSEGGSINDELLFRYAVDRTATMTNVWLGMTGQCAVCHSHKFDPISHKEFYSLYAFFNSAADPGFDGNAAQTKPVLPLPTPEQEKQLAELDARLPELRKAFDAAFAAVAYADPASAESPAETAADPTKSFAAWWKERTDKPKLDDVPKELQGLVRNGPEKTTKPADVEKIRRHWLLNVWAERPEALTQAKSDVEAAQKQRDALDKQIVRTFIFNDLPKMRDSFVMLRGAYDKKGDKVERGTPAFLPALEVATEGKPSRLDLAKWLVSAEQPLAPRVAANRLWQQFFGTGLVKTSEDFGLQGEPPSHPELLDWLAAEYRESGWDTRRIVKLLVTSRAFRRTSAVRPEQLAADPDNRLLARGPRIRLDAEQIRDNALAVAGLLVPTIGGKGVRPYQPDNIWEPVGFANSNTRSYKRDTGPALYRRSLYTFFKRTAPPPFMVNFDAPNREQFCARRERSNTPLQALQLMNDVQHVEAARALAERTLSGGGADDAAKTAWLFRTVLARTPEPSEADVVAETLAGHRARYKADPEAAKKAIAHGESKPSQSLAADELAAWTLVANMILNLDETVTRN